MRVRYFARAWIAIALVIPTVAGCGTGHSEPKHSGGSEFRENLETWSLPLDSYLVDQRQQDYAESLLYARCMRTHHYHAVAHNIADYLPPNRNAVFRKLFSLNLAQKYGYHGGPTKKDPGQLPRPDLAGAEAAQDQACGQDARKQLMENSALINFVQQLAGSAEDVAEADPAVKSAIARWRSCMLPLGIADLPDSPMKMPTATQRARFGLNGLTTPTPDNPPKPTTVASPAEIRQAVFDANCQISSGYAKGFYEAEVHKQQSLIDLNQDGLTRASSAKSASAAAVAQVLQQDGG